MTPRRVGEAAEQVAAEYYRAHGFTVVGRNVRFGRIEVDLLARKGPLLALVEVRARGPGAYQRAFASVTGPKLRRLRAALAAVWKQARRDPSIERLRLDVAAVNLWVVPVEIEIAEAVNPVV